MHSKRTAGFTLIEVLVVVAILALLVGILLPSLSRARQQGKAAVCLSNMRQLGMAVIMYAHKYDGYSVDYGLSHGGSVDKDRTWYETLEKDYGDKLVMQCPADKSPFWEREHVTNSTRRLTSYGLNDYLAGREEGYEGYRKIHRVPRPSTTIIFVEMNEQSDFATSDHIHAADFIGDPTQPEKQMELKQHLGKAHYAMVDGSVHPYLFPDTFEPLKSIFDRQTGGLTVYWKHNMYDPKVGF